MRFRFSLSGVAAVFAMSVAVTSVSYADTFNFTSCHLSGGCGAATQFGTVTLTQVGANVTFDVVLNSGNRFVETGASGQQLFLFNDTVAGSTVTNITSTLNGSTVSITGGLTGVTNASIDTGPTGTFTGGISCTLSSSCNGGSTPNINDLHFTVTNATIAQLTHTNGSGNIFAADVLCGQTGCTGQTGVLDVSSVAIPGPVVGAGLPGLIAAAGGLIALARRRRQRQA